MKRLITVAVLLAALISIGVTSSQAAFVSRSSVTVTAVAATGGTPTVSFSLAIKSVSNVNGPNQTQVTWTGIDPTNLGGNSWKLADQVLVIQSTITNLAGGIQIITDNTHPQAAPQFVDATPSISTNTDSNPAGLLFVPATGNQSNSAISLAWSIKASSQNIGADLLPADPNNGPTTGAGNKFQWVFMADKKTPAIPLTNTIAFVDGNAGSTIMNQSGIHFGQDPAEFGGGPGAKTSYLYLQADFSQALPAQTYKTSKLTVEAFTQ